MNDECTNPIAENREQPPAAQPESNTQTSESIAATSAIATEAAAMQPAPAIAPAPAIEPMPSIAPMPAIAPAPMASAEYTDTPTAYAASTPAPAYATPAPEPSWRPAPYAAPVAEPARYTATSPSAYASAYAEPSYRASEAAYAEPALHIPTPSAGAREPFYKENVRHESRTRMSTRFKRAIAIAAVVSLLGGGAIGLGIGMGIPIADRYIVPKLLDDSDEVNAFRFDNTPDAQTVGAFNGESVGYADIIAAVEPSVVNISANITREQTLFNYTVPQQGTVAGSGILFLETDTKYYIVTNNHVTEGAQQVFISIEGSEGIPAALVGKDATNDLAVVSIMKADVQKAGVQRVVLATFGDSDAMRVGDAVLAIGNALGEGNTATNGIISAAAKQVSMQDKELTLLQTNAAINEGNSGGPLVNMKGEVIGINTAKLSAGGASASIEGMGYAIPSGVVKPIVEGLMQSKPMLGVEINNLSEEMAKQFNLPQAGVIILGLIPNAPAEKAGLKINDIITGVNDDPVLTVEQLQNAVKSYKIGDTVNVKIIRDGKEFLTIPVKLAENDITTF